MISIDLIMYPLFGGLFGFLIAAAWKLTKMAIERW